jgi:hypothetical protein
VLRGQRNGSPRSLVSVFLMGHQIPRTCHSGSLIWAMAVFISDKLQAYLNPVFVNSLRSEVNYPLKFVGSHS